MKHPSQWKEAQTREIDIVEAKELVAAKLKALAVADFNSLDSTDWLLLGKDLEAIQIFIEKIIEISSN